MQIYKKYCVSDYIGGGYFENMVKRALAVCFLFLILTEIM